MLMPRHTSDHSSAGQSSPRSTVRNEVARQIVERYLDRLKVYVRHHLSQKIRRHEGTDDVVQDALRSFLSYLDKHPSVLDESGGVADQEATEKALMTFVARKVLNVARKYNGTQARDIVRERPALVIQDDGDEIEIWDLEQIKSGPSTRDAEIAADRVESLCERLTEEEFQIVHWRYWEQLSYKDIADRLGLKTEKAIQVRMRKIEERLRQ